MACPGRYTKSVHQLHRTSDSEWSGVPSPGFLTPHTRPHACHTGFGRRCNKTHSSLLPFLYLFLLLSPPHKFCIEKPQFLRLVHANLLTPNTFSLTPRVALTAKATTWSTGTKGFLTTGTRSTACTIILGSSKNRSQRRLKASKRKTGPRQEEDRAQPGVWPLQSRSIHADPRMSSVQRNAESAGQQAAEDPKGDADALEDADFPQCTVGRSNPNDAAHPDCGISDWGHHHCDVEPNEDREPDGAASEERHQRKRHRRGLQARRRGRQRREQHWRDRGLRVKELRVPKHNLDQHLVEM